MICKHRTILSLLMLSTLVSGSGSTLVYALPHQTKIAAGLAAASGTFAAIKEGIIYHRSIRWLSKKINVSPNDLVLSACYASGMLALSLLVQDNIARCALWTGAVLPFIIGATVGDHFIDTSKINGFYKSYFSFISELKNLSFVGTLFRCPNQNCTSICEHCKVQRMYQLYPLYAGALLGVYYINNPTPPNNPLGTSIRVPDVSQPPRQNVTHAQQPDEDCPICLENNGAQMYQIPCGNNHGLHVTCAQNLYNVHVAGTYRCDHCIPRCPSCRASLNQLQLQQDLNAPSYRYDHVD